MADEKPIFSSGNLKLYKFPNSYGASVVHDPTTNTHSIAVVKHFPDNSGWHIHYSTPFGRPRDGVDSSEIPTFLESVKNLTDEEVKAHTDKLFPPLPQEEGVKDFTNSYVGELHRDNIADHPPDAYGVNSYSMNPLAPLSERLQQATIKAHKADEWDKKIDTNIKKWLATPKEQDIGREPPFQVSPELGQDIFKWINQYNDFVTQQNAVIDQDKAGRLPDAARKKFEKDWEAPVFNLNEQRSYLTKRLKEEAERLLKHKQEL